MVPSLYQQCKLTLNIIDFMHCKNQRVLLVHHQWATKGIIRFFISVGPIFSLVSCSSCFACKNIFVAPGGSHVVVSAGLAARSEQDPVLTDEAEGVQVQFA